MIRIREATEHDITAIGELFKAAYQDHYAHEEFYHPENLKKLVFDDDTMIFVAEHEETGQLLGTSSVILDLGASGDLIGEFGRLVVHPEGRNQGLGKELMKARLDAIGDRLHIAVVENRTVHPYSQKISAGSGFFCAGFLPSKSLFKERENIIYYAKHFGNGLGLRRNHPTVIPEAYELADQILSSCGLPGEVIVDADSAAYQDTGEYDLEEMVSHGYTSLLHFERGRIAHREIFGPVKLHAGIFQLRVRNYRYILARHHGQLVGGLGFHVNTSEKSARLLELVSADRYPIRALLGEVTRLCCEDEDVAYIEADISAYSPRMQKSLLELGYLPAAYIPSMAFHRVERLDAIRMVKLLAPLQTDELQFHETSMKVARMVIQQFRQKEVSPRILELAPKAAIFKGLNPSQTAQLAAICTPATFQPGEKLIEQGEPAGQTLLMLSGCAAVSIDGNVIGTIGSGEALGELSLLRDAPHTVTATAEQPIEAATLKQDDLEKLIRRRPDIGVILYHNLAAQLGEKLLRADHQLMQ